MTLQEAYDKLFEAHVDAVSEIEEYKRVLRSISSLCNEYGNTDTIGEIAEKALGESS